jgi:SAM-dependent methyltransferase
VVATDLNGAMVEYGSGLVPGASWQQADALDLQFEDDEFDLVVCQFGVMFFPDKRAGYREALRVLKPGGRFLFNVWDRIEANEISRVLTDAVAALFPADPPQFLARTPHGYHDRPTIGRDLAAGGFTALPQFTTVAARSRAKSPRVPAIAYCQGSPLRNEIEARDASRLGEATDLAAEAIARRFGRGTVDGKIQAHTVTIEN